jgi:hypothetical protein
MALSTAAQWKWAGAENAMDFWADRIAIGFNEPCAGKLIGCFQNDSRK